MAFTSVTEGVAGGLVTARDPLLLEEGELALAAETVYYPNDPTLHSAPGRTSYGQVNGAGQGLAHCSFSGSQDILLAFSTPGTTGGTLSYADYSSTVPGAWTQFLGTLAGSSLDVVSVGPDHYVYTGDVPLHLRRNAQEALELTNMGLLPVTKTPTVALTTGTWSTEASMGEGWYWFLTTERVNDLESSFVGTPVACEMTDAAAYSFLVTFPGLRNGNATHRVIYISDRQDAGVEPPPLGAFYEVAVVAVGSATFTLGGTQTTTTAQYATSVDIAFNGATAQWGGTSSNMTGAPDGSYADVGLEGNPPYAALSFSGFSTLTAGLSLVGIQVDVTASWGTTNGPYPDAAPPTLQVNLARVTGVSTGDWAGAARANKEIVSDGKYTYGGPQDNWSDNGTFPTPMTGDDWRNGTALVVLVPYASYEYDFDRAQTGYGKWVRIDAVSVTLTYGGTYIPTFGQPFPFVTQEVSGLSLDYPAYLPPPRATTADVFENCIVQNDASDPTAICWSLPGQYEYFPPVVNRLRFQSKRRDVVTCIRRVGGTLLVGMQNQIKQLTSLGGSFDDLASDHGIVGANAACLADFPGRGTVMVYVAYNGIHGTDGISTWTLNEDLDWANTVDVDQLPQCRIVAYPTRYWIVLYFTPPGSTRNTKALVFSYHPTHDKGGKLPCSGVISVEGGGACIAYAQGVPNLFTVAGDGIVWHEDDGDANLWGVPTVQTRRWYPGGVGYEGRLEKMFVALGDGGTDGEVQVMSQGVTTQYTQRSRVLHQTTIPSAALDTTSVNGGVWRIDVLRGACEGMWTTVTAPQGSLHLRALTYQIAGFGLQDTRS